MTIFLMIVVNTPGAGAMPYPALLHASWHGCTLTDLVFPSFLFAVGTAIPFAAKKWTGLPAAAVLRQIATRSLVIFAVGYLLNWYTSMHWTENGRLAFASLQGLRIPGVLQRIAACYLLAAMAYYFLPARWLWLLVLVVLPGYWLLLYAFGQPPGPYSIEGNLVRQLDLELIGAPRLYREAGVVFDPEGLLSTLPATVTVLFGLGTGHWIRHWMRHRDAGADSPRWLAAAGAASLLMGWLWAPVFPMNKKLWTSSFVLFAGGVDILVMTVLLYVYEIRQMTAGRYFFTCLGKNPLAIYVLSNLLMLVFIWPLHGTDVYSYISIRFFQRWLPGSAGSLLFAITVALTCWLPAWWLDKKKIYISA